MGKEMKLGREELTSLVIASAEFVSSDVEKAEDYLKENGIDIRTVELEAQNLMNQIQAEIETKEAKEAEKKKKQSGKIDWSKGSGGQGQGMER